MVLLNVGPVAFFQIVKKPHTDVKNITIKRRQDHSLEAAATFDSKEAEELLKTLAHTDRFELWIYGLKSKKQLTTRPSSRHVM